MSGGLLPAFFVAATVVTVLQWVRLRRRPLLPLMAVFAFLALAHTRPDWSPWQGRFHMAAGLAGLALLYVLSPRRSHPPTAGASE